MSLLIISPCPDEAWAVRLKHSAAVHGLRVRCYGMGEPMGSPHGGDIQGTQPIALMKTLSEDYILAADAPDVLMLAREEEIMEKFRKFNSGLVVSAENNCVAPVCGIREALEAIPGRHSFPNIGLWIGERKYAIDCLQKAMDLYRHKPLTPEFDLDSHGAWMSYGLVQGTLDFALDRDCVLFQSTNAWSRADIEVRLGRIYNTYTKTWPVAVHYNGTAGDNPKYGACIEMYERLFGPDSFGINVSDQVGI